MPALMASNNKKHSSFSHSINATQSDGQYNSENNPSHVSFDLSRNSYHLLLSNKALKRMARSQESAIAGDNTLQSSTNNLASSISSTASSQADHAHANNTQPHSILKRRLNPHQSAELENVQRHRTLNMRPRELEAMASEMLLEPSEPIPIQQQSRRRSGPIVEMVSSRLASMSLTSKMDDSGSKSIHLDGDFIIQFPAKKKRRNRNKSKQLQQSCAAAHANSVVTMPSTVLIS